MSLHKRTDWPMLKQLIEALKAHGLEHDTPSQLADAFRLGWKALAAAKAEPAEDAARKELRNIVNAMRHDRSVFDDDTAFADWAVSRARWALKQAEAERKSAAEGKAS